jgi:16S rRNA processing protein RimM
MRRSEPEQPLTAAAPRRIVMGQVGAPHGVRGWVKVHGYTEDIDGLLAYPEWQIGPEASALSGGVDGHEGWRTVKVRHGQVHGKHLIVQFEGVLDREQAGRMTGLAIALRREQLPPPGEDEYYWCDLEGLEVLNQDGRSLGTVQRLMDTGANDVLVVSGERERLIPFLFGAVVVDVDLARSRMTVDWDPDF